MSVEKTPPPKPIQKLDEQGPASVREKKLASEKQDLPQQKEKVLLTISVPQLNQEAQALVQTVDQSIDRIRQDPSFYQSEALRGVRAALATLRHEVVAFLSSHSSIPQEFTARVREQLAGAAAQQSAVECARYLTELEQATKMPVREDLEKSVHTYQEKLAEPTLITGENEMTTKAKTDMVSREYKKYGNTTMLGKLVREVNDANGWLLTAEYLPDEALREETLVKDAAKAVDMRLSEMGALLRQQPERVSRDVHAAREAYHGEVRHFAEVLVGAGDVQHPALYQPELAMQYGQEAIAGYPDSITGIEQSLDWVRSLDAKISGNFNSDAQRAAIDGLFRGIRQAMEEKMDIVGRQVVGRPEVEQQYRVIALDMARLFRTVETIVDKSSLELRFKEKFENGGDTEFARSMAERSMDLDSLAYEHNLAKDGRDPLHEEIQLFLPDIAATIDSHPSLAAIRQNPEVEQMLMRLQTKPSSLQESSAHYSEFCSLRALMSSVDHPESVQQPDATALQQEIQRKIQPLTDTFRTFLTTQSYVIESGTLAIGGQVPDRGIMEAIQLYGAMQGIGLTNVSDTTAGYVRTGVKVASSIAVGVAVGAATGGLGILASSIAMGASMTAYNVVAEGRAFDTWGEATEKVGKEFALNAVGAGFGKVLAGARYAATLRNVEKVGMSAKEIFLRSMEKNGMKFLGKQYDECLGLGQRLIAAGAEGLVDTTGSAALDTAVQGGSFWENFRMNAMFCGLSIGMEFSSDARKMFKWATDMRPESLKNIDIHTQANSVEIAGLDDVCRRNGIDAKAFYDADASTSASMLQGVDNRVAEEITAMAVRIRERAKAIDQLLQTDLSSETTDARTVPESVQPMQISDVAVLRTQGIDLAQRARANLDTLPPDATRGQRKVCVRELKDYLAIHPLDELPAALRVELGELLLGRPFNPKEKSALLDAHALPGVIDELSFDELRAKDQRLAMGVTDPEERRMLIEAGLAGQPNLFQGMVKMFSDGEQYIFVKMNNGLLLFRLQKDRSKIIELTPDQYRERMTPMKAKPTLTLDGSAFTEVQIRAEMEAGRISPDAVIAAVQAQTNLENGRFYGNLTAMANYWKQEAVRLQPSPVPALAIIPPLSSSLPLPSSKPKPVSAQLSSTPTPSRPDPTKIPRIKKEDVQPPNQPHAAVPQTSKVHPASQNDDASRVPADILENHVHNSFQDPNTLEFKQSVDFVIQTADVKMVIPRTDEHGLYIGYQGYGNEVALRNAKADNINIRNAGSPQPTGTSRMILNALLQHEEVVGRNLTASPSIDSVRLSQTMPGGKKTLYYMYSASDYTVGGNRKHSVCGMTVELPEADAVQIYRSLQDNPYAVRPFFFGLAEGVQDGQANVFWQQSGPNFGDQHKQRRMIFAEEGNFENPQTPALDLQYLELEGDTWSNKGENFPQSMQQKKREAIANLEKLKSNYMERKRSGQSTKATVSY